MFSRALFLLMLCLATAAHADAPILPPALQNLQAALARANAAEQTAQQQWRTEAQHQQAALKQLTATSAALIRAGRLPPALTSVAALGAALNSTTVSGSQALSAPGLLKASQHFQQLQLAGLRSKLAHLAQLQQQAADQLTALTNLQTQYSNAGSQLSQQQTAALADAALQADSLAAALATSPTVSATTAVPLLPATPTAPLTSTARMAQKMPVAGKIITGFRQPGSTRPDGLTFRASAGAPVLSLSGGKVDYSGPFLRFGGLVIISGAGDKFSGTHLIYANLTDLTVNAGSTIQPGTVLGHLAGAATPPPTLYLEVRRRGQPVNPATFLPTAS